VLVKEAGTKSMAANSKYCDRTVTAPSPHENLLAYKNTLLACAARSDIVTIIPNREEDVFVLSKYRDEFARHVEPIWPPFETLKQVQDGKRLAEVAETANVPVPETEVFDAVRDWDRKLIIKMRYSPLTPDYVDFLDPIECEGQTDPIQHSPGPPPDRDEVLEHMFGHVPIVQEHVPIEHEYSFRALYNQGTAVATSVRRQVRGMSYSGGTSVYRDLVEDDRIETLGRRLLDHLDWHGLATVQFIKSAETGDYWLLEVNPRTWTSIPLDVRGGCDYPYFYWLLATGAPDQINPTPEIGYGSHLLYGELQYLSSVLFEEYPNTERPRISQAVYDVLSSLYRHPNFDFLVWDDPMPFVHEVLKNQLND